MRSSHRHFKSAPTSSHALRRTMAKPVNTPHAARGPMFVHKADRESALQKVKTRVKRLMEEKYEFDKKQKISRTQTSACFQAAGECASEAQSAFLLKLPAELTAVIESYFQMEEYLSLHSTCKNLLPKRQEIVLFVEKMLMNCKTEEEKRALVDSTNITLKVNPMVSVRLECYASDATLAYNRGPLVAHLHKRTKEIASAIKDFRNAKSRWTQISEKAHFRIVTDEELLSQKKMLRACLTRLLDTTDLFRQESKNVKFKGWYADVQRLPVETMSAVEKLRVFSKDFNISVNAFRS